MQEDTNTLASLDPDTGLIRSVDGGTPLAWWWDGNPLRGQMPALADRPAPLIVMWSGTLSEDLFAAHPPTWLTPGHEALERCCAALRPRLEERGVRVCFRPHRRHVLSDTPSCVRFLAGHADEPFGLALCPGDLLEPEMQDDVEDHLVRIFETLGPRADLVLLDSAAPVDAQDPGSIPLPGDLLLDLIGRFVPPGTPVVRAADGPARACAPRADRVE